MNSIIIKIKDDWKLLNKITNRAYNNRLFISHLSNIIYLPKNTHVAFTPNEKMAIVVSMKLLVMAALNGRRNQLQL